MADLIYVYGSPALGAAYVLLGAVAEFTGPTGAYALSDAYLAPRTPGRSTATTRYPLTNGRLL